MTTGQVSRRQALRGFSSDRGHGVASATFAFVSGELLPFVQSVSLVLRCSWPAAPAWELAEVASPGDTASGAHGSREGPWPLGDSGPPRGHEVGAGSVAASQPACPGGLSALPVSAGLGTAQLTGAAAEQSLTHTERLRQKTLTASQSGGWEFAITVSQGGSLLRPLSWACGRPSSPRVLTGSSFCLCPDLPLQ